MTANQIRIRKLAQTVSLRLPPDLIAQMNEKVKASTPVIKDRTQLIEIAITEYLNKKP